MKYNTQDFIDDVDNLQYENDNELAYYRGKASGYQVATDMAHEDTDLAVLEDRLYSYRQSLIQDKNELKYKDNWVEEERRFICGELDAIDEARDLLLDRKENK